MSKSASPSLKHKAVLLAVTLSQTLLPLMANAADYHYRKGTPGLVVTTVPTVLVPSFDLSTKALSFDNVAVGSNGTRSLAILSTGTATLTGPVITTTGAGFSSSHDCATGLNAGSTCTTTVVFSPSAPQAYNGSLSISFDGLSSQTATLGGTGLGSQLGVDNAGQLFGSVSVGQSSSLTYNVTNSGNLPAALTYSGLPSTVLRTGTCNASLAAGATCQVILTYSPVDRVTTGGSLNIASLPLSFSGSGLPTLAQGAQVLPDGVVGVPYNAGAGYDLKPLLSVKGDSGYTVNSSVTYAVTGGALPAGMTLSSAGLLSGTPTAASAGAAVQVTATYYGVTGVQSYNVVSLSIAVSLAAAILPQAMVGTDYNTTGYDFKSQLGVTGDAAYTANQATFALANGSNALPPGMTLSGAGVLTGIPTVATAVTSFTVRATYKLKSGQQAYTIIVNGASLQVISISTGSQFACAVTTAGAVKCWGLNANGQLGIGNYTNSSVPVTVTGLSSGIAQIAVGSDQVCAITTAGAAKCWGNNNGKLGNNSAIGSTVPVDVTGLSSGVTSISTGDSSTCAVHNGAAKCWGSNGQYQLGNGTTATSLVPTAVSNLTANVASISVGNGLGGPSTGTCAVTNAGAAYCWGGGTEGQLGNGTTVNKSSPTAVTGYETSGIASISVASQHACAVTTGGAVKCWGKNSDGRLGDGTTTARYLPTAVVGLSSGGASVSAGAFHTCALTTAGSAYCWGWGGLSQLGDGAAVNRTSPVAVTGLSSGVTGISAGYYQSCAVTALGARCWGTNSWGNLGDGTLTTRPTATPVSP